MNKYSQRVQELKGKFLLLPEMQPIILSEGDLQAIEGDLGYSLPTGYREFLSRFGGYYLGVEYPITRPIGEQSASLGVIYGYKTGSYNLLRNYHDDLDNMVISPILLPIAYDLGGNKTCLFLAGKRAGTIHWWYSDEATAPYDYSNLYPIADSFDEFMQLLYLYE